MIERGLPPDFKIPRRPGTTGGTGGRTVAVPQRYLTGAVPVSASISDSLLAVAWRGRWIILICVVVALAGGIVCIQTATPIYTSTAKLYLDYVGPRIPGPDPGSLPPSEKYLNTQAELIRSRPIRTAAIEALAARRLRTFSNADIPSACLDRNITVDVGKREEIISVSFRCPYPVEAAEIVNCVVDTYMASRSEHEQKSSATVLKILREEMTRTKGELDDKQNALQEFQIEKMPLALGSAEGGGVTERYLQLQNAYTQAEIRTMEAEAFRKGVQALKGDPAALRRYVSIRGGTSAYAGSVSEGSSLEARLVELELQRDALLEKITPDHPTVAALTTEIARIEGKLAAMDQEFLSAVLGAAEQQYEEASSYREQLAQLYDEQQEQVVMLNLEIAQYQRLRSEVDQLTTYFQTLEQQIRDIQKVEGEDVGQLRMAILELAVPAESPSEPQKDRTMAVALVLGLLLGGGVAVARDWLDETLRSTDEISAALGLPVLGAVPAMSRRQEMQVRGRKVLLQPDSHEAEAFRTIRTAVFFGMPKDRAKTMLITSPAAGDGKSTLVSNLAIAVARAGQKTLILDADFRKPTQHMIFEVDHQERCLNSVFAGRIKLSAAIQPTRVDGLDLLTCGIGISSPAEILNSRRFATLLARLGDVYDRVLIDAPPVTAVTDAQIIGALCDVTILVLRADKSTRKIAQRAIDGLQSVGACLLGIVVNEVRRSGGRYGYYGAYYESDGSGSRNGRRNAGQRTRPGSKAAAIVGHGHPTGNE